MNHFEIVYFFNNNLESNKHSLILSKLSDAIDYSSTGGEATSEVISVILSLKKDFPEIYTKYNEQINDFFNYCKKIGFEILE